MLLPGGEYLQWRIPIEILFSGCKFWGIYLAEKTGFVLYCIHRFMLDNVNFYKFYKLIYDTIAILVP